MVLLVFSGFVELFLPFGQHMDGPFYYVRLTTQVKPRPNHALTEVNLKEYCKDRIAYYKVPRYWKFTDSFPITITGKVPKVEMREISIN